MSYFYTSVGKPYVQKEAYLSKETSKGYEKVSVKSPKLP